MIIIPLSAAASHSDRRRRSHPDCRAIHALRRLVHLLSGLLREPRRDVPTTVRGLRHEEAHRRLHLRSRRLHLRRLSEYPRGYGALLCLRRRNSNRRNDSDERWPDLRRLSDDTHSDRIADSAPKRGRRSTSYFLTHPIYDDASIPTGRQEPSAEPVHDGSVLEAHREREKLNEFPHFDPKPVVKLFTPDGAATWLLTDIRPGRREIAFGLCDMGFGEPELGSVDLHELSALRGKLGLPIERDRHFGAHKTLGEYASDAFEHGRIQA